MKQIKIMTNKNIQPNDDWILLLAMNNSISES